MTKISEFTEFGTAARIVFDDQDVETDWAYMRLGYTDNRFKQFNWFKAREEPSYGFDLVLDDREQEAIYQEHLKEQQQ